MLLIPKRSAIAKSALKGLLHSIVLSSILKTILSNFTVGFSVMSTIYFTCPGKIYPLLTNFFSTFSLVFPFTVLVETR